MTISAGKKMKKIYINKSINERKQQPTHIGASGETRFPLSFPRTLQKACINTVGYITRIVGEYRVASRYMHVTTQNMHYTLAPIYIITAWLTIKARQKRRSSTYTLPRFPRRRAAKIQPPLA